MFLNTSYLHSDHARYDLCNFEKLYNLLCFSIIWENKNNILHQSSVMKIELNKLNSAWYLKNIIS